MRQLGSVTWSAGLDDVQEGVCDQLAMSARRKRGEQVPQVCDLPSGALDGWSVQHPDTVLCRDRTPVAGHRAVFASGFVNSCQ